MIRLFRIEWRRMWRRRMPWILLLGVSVAMVIAGVFAFATHDASAPDPGDIEARIASELESCRNRYIDEWNAWAGGEPFIDEPDYGQYLAEYESGEALADDGCRPEYFDGFFVEDPRFCLVSLYEPLVLWRQGCPDLVGTVIENSEAHETRVEIFNPREIRIGSETYRAPQPISGGMVPGTSLFLFAVATILGASFVGAEYKSGTIETTLLWEPRRLRVLGSKLAAAAVSAFVIHVALLGFLVLVMLPAALWRGSTAGGDADFWLGLVGVVAKGGVAAAAIAAVALSISVVTRNTVGGVAVLLGYSAVSPIITQALIRTLRPIDLTENMAVFASGGEVGRFVWADGYFPTVYAHGVAGATIVMAAYVAVFVAIAFVVFQRRDID